MVRFLPRGWWGHVSTARGAGLSHAPGSTRGPPGTFPALGAPCHTTLGGAIPSRGCPCSLRLEPAALTTLTLCHRSSRWIRTAPPVPGGHRDPGTRRGGYGDEPPPFPLLGSQFGFTVGVSCPRGALSRRGRAAVATEQQCAMRDGAGRGGPYRSSSARGVGGGGSERCGGQGVPTEPLGEDCAAHQLSPGSWRGGWGEPRGCTSRFRAGLPILSAHLLSPGALEWP